MRYDTYHRALQLLTEIDVKSNRSGEAEVVDSEPLGSILREFAEKWHKERPTGLDQGTNQLGSGDIPYFMGGMMWLAEQTGIHRRRVGGIANGEFERVPLTQADALLSAIGSLALIDGTIVPKPNPQWSMEAYIAYMKERGCI